MNFLKRSVNSLFYYKMNTFLLFCVFLIIGVIIQSGLSIIAASKQTADKIRKNIGANVLIKNDNPDTGDIYYGRNKLSMESVLKIAKLPEVMDYYPIGYSMANGSDHLQPFMVETQADMKEFTNQFRIQGCSDITRLVEFESGDYELFLGRNLVKLDKNAAIISYDVASANNLSIGDTIKIDPYYNGKPAELKIIGIYKVINAVPHTDYEFYNSENLIITNIDSLVQLNGLNNIYSAIYKISDPLKIDDFIKKIRSVKLAEEDDLSMLVDQSEYRSLSRTINGMINISLTMTISTMFMGAIILTLLVLIQVKDRDREIGILLSIGENKIIIIFQMIIEVLTPILFGATIAVSISDLFTGKIIDFFGGNERTTISLQFLPVFLMYICGIMLALIASTPMIHRILCYHPREMLKDI